MVELVGIDRLVGRTRYCIEPAGTIERVPIIGGTKKIDVEAVKELDPDLVLANKEENGRADVGALMAAGLNVHVSFPQTVVEGLAYLRTLAGLLGVDEDAPPILRAQVAFDEANDAVGRDDGLRVFVPIWKDPWMTFDGRTFASDILELCGGVNVFADRPRRYPLAADLGKAPPLSEERVGDRDTRYPRVPLEEVRERRPNVVLLPDEPYEFTEAHVPDLAPLGADVVLVSGKDLFWYGTRIGGAIPRLRGLLGSLRRTG